MNDSDEDIDAQPSWMRDIQPWVANKFNKVNMFLTDIHVADAPWMINLTI